MTTGRSFPGLALGLGLLAGLSLGACRTATNGSTSLRKAPGEDRAPAAAAADTTGPRYVSELQSFELLNRVKYRDYDACTFSFEHGVRDDPGQSITRNDWCLQYGNGGDLLSVSMTADDRSRLVDLGAMGWDDLDLAQIEFPQAHAQAQREPALPAIEGHVYIVRSADANSDVTALVRVDALISGDTVTLSWRRVELGE